MRGGTYISMGLLLCSIQSLPGWNARFTPAETGVSWPDPISASERDGFLYGSWVTGTSVLYGRVRVAETARDQDILAQLDENGAVLWSKRIPPHDPEAFSLLQWHTEDGLLAVYRPESGGTPVDRVGRFNPLQEFSPHYSLRVDAYQPPPMVSGDRSYIPFPNGNVAIFEEEMNQVRILMLDSSGNEVFARVYTIPEPEGGQPIPIPGLTPTYNASLSWMEPDGYILKANASSASSLSGSVYINRLEADGSIAWQRGYALPGLSFGSVVMEDGRIVLTDIQGGMNQALNLVVLSPSGRLEFSRQIRGAFAAFILPHYLEPSGNFLLNLSLMTGVLDMGDPTTDAALLLISPDGQKVDETAFDLGKWDSIISRGRAFGEPFFEFIGYSGMGNAITHGILARCDPALGNWLTKSYIDLAGPSASFSAMFGDNMIPYLAWRDETQEWISFAALDNDLQETGDCDLLSPVEVPFYDPDIEVLPTTLQVDSRLVTVKAWNDPPARTPDPFSLVDTPLEREGICGDNGTTPPVSLWADVPAANAVGDKKAGIGWINDVAYPYIWHYSTDYWMYIGHGYSDLENIIGYDLLSGRWFWANDDWNGWHYWYANDLWEKW